MNAALTTLCEKLDGTAQRIQALGIDKTLRDQYGWQFPPLTKGDLASLATNLASKLRDAGIEDLSDETAERARVMAARLEQMWPETIPNMSGNFQAVYAYTTSMQLLDSAMNDVLGLVTVDNPKLLPAKTANRLKSVNRMMERIENNEEELRRRVLDIVKAHDAAQALPTTLQELEEARLSLEESRNKVEKIHDQAQELLIQLKNSTTNGYEKLQFINSKGEEAQELIEKCEQAYQITTTKGLSAAFDQRAIRLNISMVLWTVGLLLALGLGAQLGSTRIEVLSKALVDQHPDWGQIVMHVVLSILTVGGPLWFAWLSTKQIGQRFRLAEDYAYKASVAKAYEGYRRQAEALKDPAFASRLFSTALTRLEEAPLRLVETDTHGSPWHEFLKTKEIQNAFTTIPGFQDKVLDLAKKALDTAASFSPSVKKTDELAEKKEG